VVRSFSIQRQEEFQGAGAGNDPTLKKTLSSPVISCIAVAGLEADEPAASTRAKRVRRGHTIYVPNLR
jgi:hypothetical protein